jgi:hypothetical protein
MLGICLDLERELFYVFGQYIAGIWGPASILTAGQVPVERRMYVFPQYSAGGRVAERSVVP